MGKDIARSGDSRGQFTFPRDLTEEGTRGIGQEVGEEVETTTMRHAQYSILDVGTGGLEEELIQGDHHPFGALQAVSLDLRKLFGHKVIEYFTFGQKFKHPLTFCGGRIDIMGRVGFDTVGKPPTFTGIGDVGELVGYPPTVNVLEVSENGGEVGGRSGCGAGGGGVDVEDT